MSRFFAKLRAGLERIFFWHGRSQEQAELIPSQAHDHALVLDMKETKKVPKWKQVRYAGLVLNTKEQRTLFLSIALFLIAAGVSVWALTNERILRVPAEGGKIIEAVVGAPKYINPLYAQANDPDADLSALVFSGLFKRENGTKIAPDLAERYEWSEDGLALTVTLRDQIYFHDGVQLTSDDVIFTLRIAKDPTWRSPYSSVFRDVTFEAVDDRTVVIRLKEADSSILDALTIGILPIHIWQDIAPANALLADANIRPIGTGPFQIRSFRRSASGAILAYTLDRYNGYHGIKPYLDQIEFHFFTDRGAAETALRGGQVDAFAFVLNQNLNKLTKNEQLDYALLEMPQSTIAFFNVNDSVLKDAGIREALTLSIQRDEIIDAQSGISQAIYGPYPFENREAPTSTMEERLASARTLLDKAGWKVSDEDGLRKKSSASSTESETFTLTITVPDVSDLLSVAESLQRQWSLLGAKIDLEIKPAEQMVSNLADSHQSQIILWNILLNSNQDLYPIWWSAEADDAGLNLSNLKDRDVDDAIKNIRSATTTQALTQARRAVSDAILARFPAVFLTRPSYGYVYRSSIKGVSEKVRIGMPSDRFQDIANWYVKTAWRWK